MKNLMNRAMAILLLSIFSASFASAGETRHNHAKASGEQQSGCASSAEEGNKESKRKARERSAQEQEFDRVLMAIYG
jgi:hypothetical protein